LPISGTVMGLLSASRTTQNPAVIGLSLRRTWHPGRYNESGREIITTDGIAGRSSQ
jgi:hypothetical protein